MRAVILVCLLGASLARVTYPWHPRHVQQDPDHDAAFVCHLDQASCGCCLMLQQSDRLRTYFKSTLDALEEEYSEAKRSFDILASSRTAASVALHDANSLKCYGPFGRDEAIVYQHVFLNLGGAYDRQTGALTARHSGVYILALTVYSDAGAPGNKLAACATLRVNGQVITATRDQNVNDQEDSDTVVVARHLRAGDHVTVTLPRGCFLCDDVSHYNTFSGFLLYATE